MNDHIIGILKWLRDCPQETSQVIISKYIQFKILLEGKRKIKQGYTGSGKEGNTVNH